MMKLKFILLVSAVALFLGCRRNAASTYEGVVMDTVAVDVRKPVQKNVRDYFSRLEIIPLETSRESAISNIDRVIIDNGFLYIFDHNRDAVLIFDKEGYFQRKIERKGRGPGEYVGLLDVSLNRNTGHLSFLTDIPEKIMRYDQNGRFVDDEETPFLFDWIANDDGRDILFNAFKQESAEDDYFLWIKNDMEYIKRLPIQKTNNFFIGGPSVVESQHVCFTERYGNVIMKIEDEDAVPMYYLDFGSHWMSDSQFEDNEQNNQFFVLESHQNKIVHSISAIRETKDYLVFKTNLFGFVIYNKQTRTADYLSELEDNESGFRNMNYFAHDGDDQKMLFVESVNNIRNITPRVEGDDNSPNRRRLLDLASTLEDDANPVLLLYTFKE
jgi:hypothetical protein